MSQGRDPSEAPRRAAVLAPDSSAATPWSGPWRIAIGLALVAAGGLLALAARGDLWLDEVWSIDRVGQVRSPLEIFLQRHDNNHLLYSLLLYALRPIGSDFVYRLPAVFGGLASVALGAAIVARTGGVRDGSPRARALLAAIFLGTSYLLVACGSDARGYGLALGFSLLAFFAAVRGDLGPRSRWALIYGAAVTLALLANATAVHIPAGVAAWSAVRWARRGPRGLALLVAAVRWHALPAAAAALLYFGFLRGIVIGGAPAENVLPVVGRTVAYTCGLPIGLGTGFLLTVGCAVLAAGIGRLFARGDDLGVLYLTAILVSPICVLGFSANEQVFERHFEVSAALGLLLVAGMLGALAARGLPGTLAATTLAALFVYGNAGRLERLLEDGRGRYSAALTHILATGPGGRVVVSGDNDWRNSVVGRYYAARVPGGERLFYVPREKWTGAGPDWYLVHRFEGEPAPEQRLSGLPGYRYVLDADYPCAPLGGWRWYLFRRVADVSVKDQRK